MSQVTWMTVLGVMVAVAAVILAFWLGVWYGFRWAAVPIPPRPTLCPWCGGRLRSVLVWSSVCRVCNRGQVGPFDSKRTDGIHLGWCPDKPKPAPPFVSHVDVPARHASDSAGGYPWKGL